MRALKYPLSTKYVHQEIFYSKEKIFTTVFRPDPGYTGLRLVTSDMSRISSVESLTNQLTLEKKIKRKDDSRAINRYILRYIFLLFHGHYVSVLFYTFIGIYIFKIGFIDIKAPFKYHQMPIKLSMWLYIYRVIAYWNSIHALSMHAHSPLAQ